MRIRCCDNEGYLQAFLNLKKRIYIIIYLIYKVHVGLTINNTFFLEYIDITNPFTIRLVNLMTKSS